MDRRFVRTCVLSPSVWRAGDRKIRSEWGVLMLKHKLIFGVVVVGLAVLDFCLPLRLLAHSAVFRAHPQESQPKNANQKVMSESPIACNLTALSKEQRKRHQSLSIELRGIVQEIRELPDGYAFRFPADEATIQKAAEWITLERRCCPFLDFGLDVGREGGP